jgi:hypothetical protein
MQRYRRRRDFQVAFGLLVALVALGVTQAALVRTAAAQAKTAAQAPRFEVDPFWPKPLPNHG